MVSYYWWGVRIRLNHEQTKRLVEALAVGAAVDSILLAFGLPHWVIAFVAVALALITWWIAASDDGNGVALYVTWNGVAWVENPPAWA
jgi:hypothetical protein